MTTNRVFARPSWEDGFFKQLKGTTMTLSGQTRIATTSGLTLTDGAGGFIPIILTGGSENYVLTKINNEVVFRQSTGSGDTTFNTHRPTTRPLIPVVTVGGANTVKNFLEGYFFPAVGPTSSLSVATGGATREFGDTTTGNLGWNVYKHTNNISAIKLSTDGSGVYNCNPAVSGGGSVDQSGSASYTVGSYPLLPTTATTSTSITYNLSATTVSGETTTSTAGIVWSNRKYYFASNTYYTDSTINTLLNSTSGVLSTSIALSTSMTFSNEFFYYVYPKIFGLPTFVIGGFLNNGWGNPNAGTLYTLTRTNAFGVVNQFYVARSDYRLNNTFSIIVS